MVGLGSCEVEHPDGAWQSVESMLAKTTDCHALRASHPSLAIKAIHPAASSQTLAHGISYPA
jgi:hypothetical protein